MTVPGAIVNTDAATAGAVLELLLLVMQSYRLAALPATGDENHQGKL